MPIPYNGFMAELDLNKIIADPKLTRNLSMPQLAAVVAEMEQLLTKKRNSIPADPQSFAMKFGLRTKLGEPWQGARHLTMLSQWLSELESRKRRRLIITMPPRHGKSNLTSYAFPLWYLLRNPQHSVMLTSYEYKYAAEWGQLVRDTIISRGSEWNVEVDRGQMARDSWKLTSGGVMYSIGAGGALVGKGAHLMVIDDPIKNYEEASSETMRANLWDWFLSTAFTRMEPNGVIVVLHTRWFQDDLIGRLLQQNDEHFDKLEKGQESNYIPWDVFNLPAEAEEGDPLGRQVGEWLWPERFSELEMKSIKASQSPYQWSAQYQQRPSPEAGGAVKRDWWQFYNKTAVPADMDIVIQAWDLAFHDLTKSDYCVGQVWGRKGSQFYLLDQVRDHMNIMQVVAAARALTARWPQASAKLVEDRANGPAMIQMLQREITGMIPIKPKNTKDARLQAVIPMINAGNVYLPQNPDGSKPKWVWEFIEECAVFPNGAHDDQLDTMVHALGYLVPQGWLHVGRGWNEAKLGPPPQTPLELQTYRIHKWKNDVIKKHEKQVQRQLAGGRFKIRAPKVW